MRVPIIGVVPLWDEEKESLWMLPGYMDGIRHAGGLPVMLPLTSDKTIIDKICTVFAASMNRIANPCFFALVSVAFATVSVTTTTTSTSSGTEVASCDTN